MATNRLSGEGGHVTTPRVSTIRRLVRGDFARPAIVLTFVFSLACIVLSHCLP